MKNNASPLVPPSDVPFEFEWRKTLARGSHVSLVSDSVKPLSGRGFEYEIAVREGNPKIVTALPITKDGEALLIWQYRIPMRRYVLENVAGLVNPWMTPVATVVKEILEETGYTVSLENVVDLDISTPTSSGATTEVVECFAAFGAEFSWKQSLEAAEAIRVVKLPVDTAFETVLATAESGELVDAKVFALLSVVRKKFRHLFPQ